MRSDSTNPKSGTTRVVVSTPGLNVPNTSVLLFVEAWPTRGGTPLVWDWNPARGPATKTLFIGPWFMVMVPSSAMPYVKSLLVSITAAAPLSPGSGSPRETTRCAMVPVPSLLKLQMPFRLDELVEACPMDARVVNPAGGTYKPGG